MAIRHFEFWHIQKYEKGTNRIGAGRLWQFAQVFRVPVQALYEGMALANGKDRSSLHLIAKRDPLRIVEAFDKIQDRTLRKAITTLVERIAVKSGA